MPVVRKMLIVTNALYHIRKNDRQPTLRRYLVPPFESLESSITNRFISFASGSLSGTKMREKRKTCKQEERA